MVRPFYDNEDSIMLKVALYSGRIFQDSMVINIAEALPTIDISLINKNLFEDYEYERLMKELPKYSGKAYVSINKNKEG